MRTYMFCLRRGGGTARVVSAVWCKFRVWLYAARNRFRWRYIYNPRFPLARRNKFGGSSHTSISESLDVRMGHLCKKQGTMQVHPKDVNITSAGCICAKFTQYWHLFTLFQMVLCEVQHVFVRKLRYWNTLRLVPRTIHTSMLVCVIHIHKGIYVTCA